jgi:uncharacterized protein YjiS (DUF1127 family)
MNTTLLLSRLAGLWQQLACRLREAARLRRDMQVLSSMSATELRDIGISHGAIAAAGRLSCCQ